MESQMDRRTDKRTNGTDENYIPFGHTSYAGGIINCYKRIGYSLDIM